MPINSRLGKKMDLEIERLGINGEGVGQWYGCTMFVDGALPGESVLASLIEKRKSYGRARVIRHHSFSPHRQSPVCPLFGKCGGCQLMHLDYSEQLKAKRQRVVDALERIGKLKEVTVGDCRASPSPLNYRNKIQLPVAKKGDALTLGLYARSSHDLIEMEHCHIHCPLGEMAYQKIQAILKSSSLRPYDPVTEEGELRHVLIKTGVFSNQVLVILVSKKEPTEELRHVAKEMLEALPEIKGVVHNLNSFDSNTVLGSDFETLAGLGSIEEHLLGLTFKVSPASFFQVNPSQAEKLYEHVLEVSGVTAADIVLDAYCGVGTLSLLFAKRAKRVIGVECVKEAIDDAKENAEKNGLTNTEFVCDAAESFIGGVKEADIAILNPPRKGCEKSVLDSLSLLKPKRIVYVSCDPATLARDLALLTEKGWQVGNVQPFDMFPQTAHVESVAFLTLQ